MSSCRLFRSPEMARPSWLFNDSGPHGDPPSEDGCLILMEVLSNRNRTHRGSRPPLQLPCVLGRSTVSEPCGGSVCQLCLRDGGLFYNLSSFLLPQLSLYRLFQLSANSPLLSPFASFNIFLHFWIGLAVNEWRKKLGILAFGENFFNSFEAIEIKRQSLKERLELNWLTFKLRLVISLFYFGFEQVTSFSLGKGGVCFLFFYWAIGGR